MILDGATTAAHGRGANGIGTAAPQAPHVPPKLTPVQQGQALAEKDKAGGKPSVAADFAAPKTPAAAPASIRFAAGVQKVFDTQWGASFPGGKSKEQGGTLTFNKATGTVGIQNVGGDGSTSGSFSPNLVLPHPKQDGVLGAFHTHPYDKSEGGYTGVSLSGGDAAYMINEKQNVGMAQSGDRQFMYLRTQATPAKVDFDAVNDAQNNRITALMGKGADFAGASRTAAAETAQKYNLAYYEGTGGVLTRVFPK